MKGKLQRVKGKNFHPSQFTLQTSWEALGYGE